MNKCQRCLKNDISLQCLHCPTINKLCSLCDKKIHNIVSKANHTRLPKENITISLNDNLSFENRKEPNEQKFNDIIFIEDNQKIEDNEETDNFNSYNNSKSIILNPNNSSKDNFTSLNKVNENINDDKTIPDKYNNSQFYLNRNRSQSSKNIHQISFSKDNNDNNLIFQNSQKFHRNLSNQTYNTLYTSKLLSAENYSKEYINELKKIFKKEKDELIYKNKALENSINRLKIEFNEQISQLTKELEILKSNNIINIKVLKDNYQKKIDEMTKFDKNEISSLKEKILSFKNDNEIMNNSYYKEINEKNKIIENLKKENEKIINKINIKDEEIKKLKNSFEEISIQYENKFNDNKNQIINEYEQKIKDIVDSVEKSKDNLINLIDKRELNIKNVLENKNNEIQKLNTDINKLKEELKCHKVNLIRIKNINNNLSEENQIMKNRLFQNECNGERQCNEINRLKGENENLYEQVDNLKIELSKLDKIVYGRIRTKF